MALETDSPSLLLWASLERNNARLDLERPWECHPARMEAHNLLLLLTCVCASLSPLGFTTAGQAVAQEARKAAARTCLSPWARDGRNWPHLPGLGQGVNAWSQERSSAALLAHTPPPAMVVIPGEQKGAWLSMGFI